MGNDGKLGTWGPLGMITWLLILVAVVAAVFWLLRSILGAGGREPLPPSRPGGLDILEERYARGEIDRDEYLQKKRGPDYLTPMMRHALTFGLILGLSVTMTIATEFSHFVV